MVYEHLASAETLVITGIVPAANAASMRINVSLFIWIPSNHRDAGRKICIHVSEINLPL